MVVNTSFMQADAKNLPPWNDETSPAELKQALAGRRFKDAEGLVEALLADLDDRPRRVPTETATAILATLRASAWFEHLYQVAAKLGELGQTDVEVLRQLAQARIEQGCVTAAIGGLLELRAAVDQELEDDELDPPEIDRLEREKSEVVGLLGRSYKQLYVDAEPTRSEPRCQDLERALEFYGDAYAQGLGDYMWHGVNYIALMTHARRIKKGQAAAISRKARAHAEKILAAIDAKERAGELQVWDLPNRAECNLARGESEQAVEALQGYLEDPQVRPFNIQSTRRQLVQLWLLSEDVYPGSVVLPMMKARLAELGPGEVPLELSPADAPKYEKVYGDTKYKPLKWLQQALERARCVARLGPDKYEGWGTGFLFDGAWLGDDYAGRHLLLTNAHVVSNDPVVQAQFPNPKGPEDNTAAFLGTGDDDVAELAIRRLIWTSPPAKLDATLLEIDPPPDGAEPPRLARSLPKAEGKDARVNVIGHPRGFSLRVSMQDNQVVKVDEPPFIHYRTPTDPGSSGSPVFNQRWELVALHHASSSAIGANEGVRMDRLLAAMRADLGLA